MRKIPVVKDCAEPGCTGAAHTKGLCLNHYRAMRRAEKRAKTEPAPAHD